MELSGQLYALATLPLGKSPDTHSVGGCGASCQSGYLGEEGSLLPHLGIKPCFLGPLAPSPACVYFL